MWRPLLPLLPLLAWPATAASPALDLPAGRLGDVVRALGRATQTSISVEDPALWSRPVPALRGKMSARAALRRLAEAAGAEMRPAGPNGYRLLAKAPPRPRAVVAAAPHHIARAPVQPAPQDDIIITASKRDVRLSDLAGQVSLLDGADLSFGGPGGTDAILSRLSSVSSTHLGAGRNKLFIRGIADSSFTGPTQSTVGQYIGDLRLTYNAPDPDLRLYDVASVEVLEGPQGTLYGAGSLGGIIRLTPTAPALGQAGGSIAAGVATTAHGDPSGDLSAMLNLPVVRDRAALRIVGYGISEGGYIDNPLRDEKDINRTRTIGGRATLRLEAGDGWTIDLGGVGQRTRGDDSQYADRNATRLTRSSAIAQGFFASYAMGSVVVSKDWGGLRFRSSNGIASQHLRERYDAGVPAGYVLPGTGVDVLPFAAGAVLSKGEERVFIQQNQTRLLASESRLWRPLAGGFGWVIGTSLTSNRTEQQRAIGPDGSILPATGVVNRADEYTLYGEASVAPVRGLILTGGGRISHARLSGAAVDVPPIFALRATAEGDRHATTVLPSASAVATLLPRLSAFVRYQEGFRPGGLAVESNFVRRFDGDHVATLESGLRFGQPRRDRFDLTASVSHTRWDDIQADFIDATGLPSTANIGDGRIWTASFAAGWKPIEALRLDIGATFNDSSVREPVEPIMRTALARMSRVPNVARYAGRIGLDYVRPVDGDLTLRINGWARYVGKSRLGIGPMLGEAQGDYLDTALTMRLGRPRLGATLSVTNIADQVGNRFALGTPFAVGQGQITPLRPRTIRLGLDASF
ncbi:TonB-dependent receptor [Sphingomonas sp. AP4-R1]|nr:TonB-dependent receptor [Sphingomonas sp. AP4-R1]